MRYVLLLCFLLLAACSSSSESLNPSDLNVSSSTKPASTKNNDLWSDGQMAFKILQTATSSEEFKRMSSKDSDVIISFLNKYGAEKGLSKQEYNIVYNVERGFDNYQDSMSGTTSSMDKMNTRALARQSVKELKGIYGEK